MRGMWFGSVILVAASLIITGCSGWSTDKVLPDRKVDYKKSRQASRDLEVPPDLSSEAIASGQYMPEIGTPAVTTYSEFATGREDSGGEAKPNRGVLPENPTARIERDGQERWLAIDAPADDVWENVVDFWRENGILLMEQDPVAGVMRTTWIENRAEIKSDVITNFFRTTIGQVYSTGTRDQYRVRLERGETADSTDLYLTHYRMEEELVSQTGATDIDRHIWVPKGSDPDLEAVMLQKIMTYMGIANQDASAVAGVGAESAQKRRSDLITGRGAPRLVVHDDFARSWRLVGIALDRVGFSVEDRDRSAGRYYVRYNDPSREQSDQDEGWLSRMAFWRDKTPQVASGSRYIIELREIGEDTEAVVLTEQGIEENSDTSRRILTLVHEQIR